MELSDADFDEHLREYDGLLEISELIDLWKGEKGYDVASDVFKSLVQVLNEYKGGNILIDVYKEVSVRNRDALKAFDKGINHYKPYEIFVHATRIGSSYNTPPIQYPIVKLRINFFELCKAYNKVPFKQGYLPYPTFIIKRIIDGTREKNNRQELLSEIDKLKEITSHTKLWRTFAVLSRDWLLKSSGTPPSAKDVLNCMKEFGSIFEFDFDMKEGKGIFIFIDNNHKHQSKSFRTLNTYLSHIKKDEGNQ